MKKYIISFTIFCNLIYCADVFSQIGIMTDNPVSNVLVHVDAASNNSGGGVNINRDDVVVSKDGKVGIGTTTPQTKLHIVTGGTSATPNPQLRIEDGNAAVNKVLMSDANGLGQWNDYIPGYKNGNIGAGIAFATLGNSNNWFKTNMSVSVDPGQWLVFFSVSMITNQVTVADRNYRIWIQVTLGDDSSIATPDAISKNRFSNTGFINKRAIVNGWVAVNNNTTAAKRYVVYVGAAQNAEIAGLQILSVAEKNDGYSSMYAYRIKMLN